MLCPYCRTDLPPGALRCSACTSWLPDRPATREWRRAREGRMVAGVCRGLANHYGLLWMLMPLEPELPRPAPAPAAPAVP